MENLIEAISAKPAVKEKIASLQQPFKHVQTIERKIEAAQISKDFLRDYPYGDFIEHLFVEK